MVLSTLSLSRSWMTLLSALAVFGSWIHSSLAWEVSHQLPTYSNAIHGKHFAAGVIIYSVVKNRPYILLGQEQGGNGKGTWCIMLGLRGDKDDSQTTLEAAAREMHEESAGVYQINPSDLSKFPYLDSDSGGVFVVPGEYIDESVINQSVLIQSDGAFREMSNYVWADLQDLRAFLRNRSYPSTTEFATQTPSGRTTTVKLRPCASRILKDAEAGGYLAAIPHRIQAGPMWARPPKDPAEKCVRSCYHEILNREPDPIGMRDWCNVYRCSGAETVKNGISHSDEAFVKACYREYLKRWPEDGGLHYWCSELPRRGRDGVREAISNSEEARQKR